MSIRHKLFAALAGFTLLICLAYTALALVVSYVTEDMLIDRLLEREAAAITTQGRLAGNDLIRVHDSVDTLPAVVRQHVAAGRTRGEIFTDTGQHYHLRTLDVPAGRRYLLADVRPILVVSALVRDVGGVLVTLALALIALALLLAWWLSRRLVAPLLRLADEVRDAAPGTPVDFHARQRGDEIGYLADKLSSTLADLHAALAREHAFTRDVSHELRTPLTIMNNALGQATTDLLEPRDVALLRAGLDDIHQTVDVLFALARAEHIADETFDLRGCIEDSLLRQLDGDGEPSRLTLALPERLPVLGNRHLAALLINNCVGNALFHGGAGARLRLSCTAGTLNIVNSVDPTRTGAIQGFRHGQQLLRRIAAAMRWEIAFHAEAMAYRVEIVPLRPQ